MSWLPVAVVAVFCVAWWVIGWRWERRYGQAWRELERRRKWTGQ